MKFLGIFLICNLFSYCYIEKNNLKQSVDFDTIKSVNRVSFFNEITYDTLNNKKGGFLLLFKDGKLNYVAAGRKFKKSSAVYKVSTVNDTIQMLSSDNFGRYYVLDTLLFISDICFRKMVTYDNPQMRNESIMTQFNVYHFMNDSAFLYRDMHPLNDTIGIKEPVIDFANRAQLAISQKIKFTQSSQPMKYYKDKEEAKFDFSGYFLR